MSFAAGSLIGPMWGGMVKSRIGWGGMVWTLGLLSAVTTVPTTLLCGGWIGDAVKRRRTNNTEKRAESGGG